MLSGFPTWCGSWGSLPCTSCLLETKSSLSKTTGGSDHFSPYLPALPVFALLILSVDQPCADEGIRWWTIFLSLLLEPCSFFSFQRSRKHFSWLHSIRMPIIAAQWGIHWYTISPVSFFAKQNQLGFLKTIPEEYSGVSRREWWIVVFVILYSFGSYQQRLLKSYRSKPMLWTSIWQQTVV